MRRSRRKLVRQRERQLLLRRRDLLDVTEAVLGQPLQHLRDQVLRDRRATGDPDRRDAVEPAGPDVADVVDQVRRASAGVQRHLDEADRVRRVRGADDEHEVGGGGDVLHRGLPVLGGVTDVVARRVDELGEPAAQRGDGLERLVHRQRRLRQPGDLGRIAHLDPVHRLGAVDEMDALGRLPRRTDDLLVALVPDEEDVVVLAVEPPRLRVHLRHERAGRVDRAQPAARRLLVDDRCDTVRGEDHDRALGHLRGLVDEDRAAALERHGRRASCGRSACGRRRGRRSSRVPARRSAPRGRRRRSTRAGWPAAPCGPAARSSASPVDAMSGRRRRSGRHPPPCRPGWTDAG